MRVSLTRPFGAAWRRARAQLFKPMDLATWLGLGFTAWLAGLTDGGWAANQYSGSGIREQLSPGKAAVLPEFLSHTWQQVLAGGVILYLVAGLAVVFLGFWLALVWVSSRSKFVFLDNVVHGRSRVVEPWNRFGALGNSLFFWRIGFGFAILVLMLAAVLLVVFALVPSFSGPTDIGARIGIAMTAGLGILVGGLVVAFVSLLLEGFVIPVMYRDGVGVLEAWRRFLPLLRGHFLEFALYGVFVLVLWALLGFALFVVGVATCCVGFILLAVPLLGTLILLPVPVTYRAFSLEFLAQFGEAWRVIPEAPPAPDGSAS